MKTCSISPSISPSPWTLPITSNQHGTTSFAISSRPSALFRFSWESATTKRSRPRTREQYIIQFGDWLDSPTLRVQRLSDDPFAHKLTTYYHWIQNGVDFINLDNSTPDQFDSAQMKWFEKTLRAAESNSQIRTVVVGMHEALPESISANHSMDQSANGIESGRRVYLDLLKAQNEAHKHVYVLASHSHYFMDGIFNTDYWRANGGVLPGWIIGTAEPCATLCPKNRRRRTLRKPTCTVSCSPK